MDDLTEFAGLMGSLQPQLDVALAMVAASGRPAVDPTALVARLDALAESVDASEPGALCTELFDPDGFSGDTDNYYDPRNSLLDQVLDRRVGIPITLSVLAIEIGRRRGLDLAGIGMPGHFLLRERQGHQRYFDPFRGGITLDKKAIRRLFVQIHGDGAAFREEFLQPTPTTIIVSRVLNNLRGAYARIDDRDGLIRSLAMQAVLPGSGPDIRRQLAQALAADGQFLEAAETHDQLIGLDPDRAEHHERSALRLRAQLN